MECPNCKKDKPIKDFLGKHACYKCVYLDKMKTLKKKPEERKCPICGNPPISAKALYCSDDCKLAIDRQRSLATYYKKKERILTQGVEL